MLSIRGFWKSNCESTTMGSTDGTTTLPIWESSTKALSSEAFAMLVMQTIEVTAHIQQQEHQNSCQSSWSTITCTHTTHKEKPPQS